MFLLLSLIPCLGALYTEYYLPNHRCGPKHLIQTAEGEEVVSGCKTTPNFPTRCCSEYGWCGNSEQHCSCEKCVVYSYQWISAVYRSSHTRVLAHSKYKQSLDCVEVLPEFSGRSFLDEISIGPNQELGLTGACFGQSLFISDDLTEF